MQYPVPQFTEVEDRLIGPLSIKQFFIVFMAGILIFAGYSATKSVWALVILFLIFGVPALALAFAKINGRPVYKQLSFLLQFFTAPRKMVFHKESSNFGVNTKIKDIEMPNAKKEEIQPKGTTQERLREVQVILKKQQEEEEQLAKKI
ncbi:MAG: PrgI family protein [Patescibacteria group bacterium]